MPNLRLLLLLCLLPASAPLWAQEPRQPVRLELAYEPDNSFVEVIPVPDSSLLVYSRKSDAWLRNPVYKFEKYDAQLEQVWSSPIEFKPEYDLVRYFTEFPYTYLVFKGSDSEKYTFVKLNLLNGALSQQEHLLDKVEDIYELNVLEGKYFIIGGNSYDPKPFLLYLDPQNPKPVLLPAVYGTESSFSDLMTDPMQRRTDVVMTESNGRISRLQVKSFKPDGKLLHNYFILQQDKRSLLNAEITPGDTLSRLLIGTFGQRDLRYAQGFFTTPVASQEISGEFYTFPQLQNFFKYMKPRREQRTRKREMARAAEGKEPLNRYRMLLHDLMITPYGYVLAAEVYYPQYRSNSGYLDPRTRGFERRATNYKRTHAVALGFDENGILLWDNAFPLNNVSTGELVHAIEAASLPDGRLVMAYPESSKIHYRIMAQDRFTDEDTSLEILPYEKEEKIASTDYPGIVRWYDNHFAAFGFQRIRNTKGPNRTVFYITKIAF